MNKTNINAASQRAYGAALVAVVAVTILLVLLGYRPPKTVSTDRELMLWGILGFVVIYAAPWWWAVQSIKADVSPARSRENAQRTNRLLGISFALAGATVATAAQVRLYGKLSLWGYLGLLVMWLAMLSMKARMRTVIERKAGRK